MLYTKVLIIDKGPDYEALEKAGLDVAGEEKWVDFAIELRSIIGFRPYNDEDKSVCIYIPGDSFILPYSFGEFSTIFNKEVNSKEPYTRTFTFKQPTI